MLDEKEFWRWFKQAEHNLNSAELILSFIKETFEKCSK